MVGQGSSYLFLAVAIICEVIGTALLQKSEQFTKLLPTVLMGLCFLSTFYFLSLALRTIPVGIAYGIWGSFGIVLTALVGFFVFKQRLDLPAMIGIGLMISGVVVIQLFSKTTQH